MCTYDVCYYANRLTLPDHPSDDAREVACIGWSLNPRAMCAGRSRSQAVILPKLSTLRQGNGNRRADRLGDLASRCCDGEGGYWEESEYPS